MAEGENKSAGEKYAGSRSVLQVLDSLLMGSGQKRINADQVMIILDALASADDPALLGRFPVLLAICARRGIELNSQALFSRYWSTSPKRRNLEKLLLASALVLERAGLEAPKNLRGIADSLRSNYGDLLADGALRLSAGRTIPVRNFHDALKKYAQGLQDAKMTREGMGPPWSVQLHRLLDRLFSPKQKDLVFKRLTGQSFTKTEREYFSRVVKKKLEAIANEEVGNIAAILTRK
ncbi:MAG: hypothetical protein JSW39_28060 [Desulfobacterales bacterium]|nr:MAG: hypothetical protein JSW39_28060 [Desulfobacterales bacterium]